MNKITKVAPGAIAPLARETLDQSACPESAVRDRPSSEANPSGSAAGTRNQPPLAPPIIPALDPAAAALPARTRQEALQRYERTIAEALAHQVQLASALLAVHTEKLYKLTHTSFRAYVEQRWGLSGSRAYQLIHLAQVKTGCREQGEPCPANERQARQLSPEGTPLTGQPTKSSYERRLRRVTRSLAASVAQLPPDERRPFLQAVHHALDQLEQQLELPPPAPSPVAAAEVTTKTAGSDSLTGAALQDSRTASSSQLGAATSPLPAERTAEVSAPYPAGLPADSATVMKSIQTPDPATRGRDTEKRPAPPGNTCSVFGFTMAEARKLGYGR